MKLFTAALGLAYVAISVGCAPGANTGSMGAATANAGVIGGHAVRQGDPFQKSIVAIYNQDERSLCSGSLLPNNIVLTAAHCVKAKASSHYIIFNVETSGTLSQSTQQRLTFVRRATAIVRHPDYGKSNKDPKAAASDVGLIKFEGPVPPGFAPATLAPSPAATSDLLKPGAKVVVAGYGDQRVNFLEVAFRKEADFQKAIDDGDVDCEPDKVTKALHCFRNQSDGGGTLRMTMLSIVGRTNSSEVELLQNQGTGVCRGDSGGPAYIPTADKKLLLFGVLSTVTVGCNGTAYYTDITTQRKWLDTTVAQLSAGAPPAPAEAVTYGSFKNFR